MAVFFSETSCSIFFVTHRLFEGRICDGHRHITEQNNTRVKLFSLCFIMLELRLCDAYVVTAKPLNLQ